MLAFEPCSRFSIHYERIFIKILTNLPFKIVYLNSNTSPFEMFISRSRLAASYYIRLATFFPKPASGFINSAFWNQIPRRKYPPNNLYAVYDHLFVIFMIRDVMFNYPYLTYLVVPQYLYCTRASTCIPIRANEHQTQHTSKFILVIFSLPHISLRQQPPWRTQYSLTQSILHSIQWKETPTQLERDNYAKKITKHNKPFEKKKYEPWPLPY